MYTCVCVCVYIYMYLVVYLFIYSCIYKYVAMHVLRQSIKKPNFRNSEPASARSTLAMVALCSGDLSFIRTLAASRHVNY